ncbi:hypothetical protein ACJJTC_013178 [Scirpophaga incertulas]
MKGFTPSTSIMSSIVMVSIKRFQWIHLLILLLLFCDISANNKNYVKLASGGNKRQVKNYSGEKLKPIICIKEGFQGDPNDCSIFHRCIKSGNGRYMSFKFQCGPGTIFDPDAEICNHPHSIKKIGCNVNFQKNTESIQNNEIVNELPSPISTKAPVFMDVVSTKITNMLNSQQLNSVKYPWKSTSTTISDSLQTSVYSKTQSITNVQSSTLHGIMFNNQPLLYQSKEICMFEGFIGDREDCRKFYRCVSNNRGGFIRYEFLCSDTTIWDDDKQVCNYYQLVKKRRCSRDNKITNEITNSYYENESVRTQTIGIKLTTPKVNYNKLDDMQEKQTTILYKLPVSELNDSNKKNAVQTHNISLIEQNQYIEGTTTIPNTQTSKKVYNNECIESGFMGEPTNCKIFYRCVDNGRGSFTRYEFSCGEGTVWDSKIESCNHAWAVKECGGFIYTNQSAESTIKTTPKSTTKILPASATYNYYTSDIPKVDENYDDGYQNQVPLINKPNEVILTTTKEPDSSDNSGCYSNGFIGDRANCKKFYRCVDSGNGQYTRYEFSCGEGTVWDSKINACNHAWAVENCGGNNDINKENSTISTTQISQSIVLSSIQTTSETNDYDVGYGHVNGDISTAVSGTTIASTNNHNVCTTDGFMGDDNDCKKFYRCVANGNGSFTKYDFSCGEGTVWDQKIIACNHAWAVEKCGTTDDVSKIETTTHSIQYTSTVTYNTNNYNNHEHNQPTISSSVSHFEYENEDISKCTSSGFMSDKKDCKKFYRCVQNGNGGFTRFEYVCGEGTVWDPKIESCNHAWAVEKCRLDNKPTQVIDEDENQIDYLTQTGENTTAIAPSISESTTTNLKNICKNSGFMRDAIDCKKFYRCVDDGQGSFIKYEFICGEGTFWDQSIESCNHEWAVNNCTQSGIQVTTALVSTGTVDNEYNIQSTETGVLSSIASSSSNKCSEAGFYADSEDCKKFYRCIHNGQGGFTKYEFTCGQGTIWVQEILACDHDTEMIGCKNETSSLESAVTTNQNQLSTSSTKTTQSNEYNEGISDKPYSESEQCKIEGFFSNKKDCTKFYRCVNNGNGGFTKYDFTCGDGTAWDTNIQACNHIQEVNNCNIIEENQTQPISHDEHIPTSTESNITPDTENHTCNQEGFFGNTQDCKKFYRCVDNGKGGFTKYDFNCGEGTIWDQDLTTCNHPEDVSNSTCKDTHSENFSSTEDVDNTPVTSSSMSSITDSRPNVTQNNTHTQNGSCTQENSNNELNQNVKCEKAGYFADPNDCKKFYRCVDWDGNGEKFSVFHFECGEGTIWDPSLETCNHEDSVYPSRNCNDIKNDNNDQESTTTKKSTTKSSTTSQLSQSNKPTTQANTIISDPTTHLTSTNEITYQTTTEIQNQSTSTTEKYNQNTTEKQTQSTTYETTTRKEITTTESTTTEYSSEKTTSQQTTFTEESTTVKSTEATTTTFQPISTEQITECDNSSITDQQSSTTEQIAMNTEKTEEQTTEGTTTTTQKYSLTTENDLVLTTEALPNKNCPETENDQYTYVCPTSFRRHPKYCNMFYQCLEDEESHDLKIATFTCPNNTIYDESKIQCVEEVKANKKCDGQIARKYRVKRLQNFKEPIEVDRNSHKCKAAGNFGFDKDSECSRIFLKCLFTKSQILRGFVYQCPEGYVYWTISKRCEKINQMKYCQTSKGRNWSNRWEIPMEMKNVAK